MRKTFLVFISILLASLAISVLFAYKNEQDLVLQQLGSNGTLIRCGFDTPCSSVLNDWLSVGISKGLVFGFVLNFLLACVYLLISLFWLIKSLIFKTGTDRTIAFKRLTFAAWLFGYTIGGLLIANLIGALFGFNAIQGLKGYP